MAIEFSSQLKISLVYYNDITKKTSLIPAVFLVCQCHLPFTSFVFCYIEVVYP